MEDRRRLTDFCGQPDPKVCEQLRAQAREDVRRLRLGLANPPTPNVRVTPEELRAHGAEQAGRMAVVAYVAAVAAMLLAAGLFWLVIRG